MENKIPLMNLQRQYDNIENEINSEVLQVLKSGKYIMGDNVKQFEKEFAEYLGVKHAISVGNGTDALIIALKAIGVRSGDEVITCAMSFFATAEAIAMVGAIPVFVDCTKDTYVLDYTKIEEKITDKTKAIIPIHLYGQCADMDEINAIAKKYNLKVIEDAAQAAGAEYKNKRAGNLGDIACFSFFPTKNLGCAGDGGIITTNNDSYAKICKAYRAHGSGLDGKYTYNILNNIKEDLNDTDFNGNQPKYFNYVVGHNSRLDEIQAAILRVKLKYLDEWNEVRIHIAGCYSDKIENQDIVCPLKGKNNKHIYYVYVIKTNHRDKLRLYLESYGITTGIYFPVPLHMQEVFKYLNYKLGDMPNAEEISEKSLAIPMFAELTNLEQDQVIKFINDFEG
ncbi:DegT/DnrJ/EryC1/StrS family aminotransferase [Sedimentibacter sp.]|uniref:DegT/DnrJ/EryC1/StrS family aminotransferase n=1 Tax=Sedimentibacter sp. TaxID=1960295 RepID=UPI0028ABD6BF|nr:DegT/DnrJ/EryC1/StrS family aminotransferase [Sedimentibacter sp.]